MNNWNKISLYVNLHDICRQGMKFYLNNIMLSRQAEIFKVDERVITRIICTAYHFPIQTT